MFSHQVAYSRLRTGSAVGVTMDSLRPPPARCQQPRRGASWLAGSRRHTHTHTHTQLRPSLPGSLMQYRRRPRGRSMPPSSLLLLLEHSQGHRLVRDLLYGAASVWALPLYPFHLGNRQTVETQRGVRSRGQMWSPPRLRPAPGPPPLPSRPGQAARVTAETTARLPESQQRPHRVFSPPRSVCLSLHLGGVFS